MAEHRVTHANEDVRQKFRDIYQRNRAKEIGVDVTFYPPEMEAERERFAISVTNVEGNRFQVGDDDYAFPLHSISKVFTYAMALEDNGRPETLLRVGVEPSGDAFNSFVFDEHHKRPFNPMVNAGALVVTNLIHGGDREEKVGRILEKLRLYAGNPALEVDEKVLAEELSGYNDRNLGLSYLMRSNGMLHGDVAENIAVYLSACSVRVTTRDLCAMGATLANGGVNPLTGQRALAREYVRDVVTVMSTCGMYDAAGQWAYDVGIPAKSGVSGGIMLTMPQYFGAAIFSPGLDVYGNSVRGIAVCRELSETFGLHVFADPAEDRLGRWSRPTG
jgi:glutaminase